MAPVRCLRVRAHAIPRFQAIPRPLHSACAPVRRYWISRPAVSYSRTRIYNKDAYYAKWTQEREARQARLCGSWTRRKLRDHATGASKEKDIHEKATSDSTRNNEFHKTQTDYTPADEFSRLLGRDAAAAYTKFMREIEKDPYRWIFDPRNTKSAWNAADWWKKQYGILEKSWMQPEMSSSTPASNQNATTSTSRSPDKGIEESEEYVIDPITLRKVFVQHEKQPSTGPMMFKQPQSQGSVTHDIPIKRHNNIGNKPSDETVKTVLSRSIDSRASSSPTKASSITNQTPPKLSGFANQPWLVKEGFTTMQQPSPEKAVLNQLTKEKTPTKIEPSLERLNNLKKASRATLQYPPPEKTADDVDLLRPEDIRAASGHIKNKNKPSRAEMEQRSKTLRSDWQNASGIYSQDLLEVYNEVLEKRRSRKDGQHPLSLPGDIKQLSNVEFKKVKEHYNELQGELDQTRKVLEQARRELLHNMLTSETKTVKENFESFETRPRNQVSIIAEPKDSVGPISSDTSKASAHEKQRQTEKLRKDQDLVSEIRNIYEQKYGAITTDHRQSSTGEEKISHELPNAVPNPQQDNLPAPTNSRSVKDPFQPTRPDQNEIVMPRSATGILLRDLLYQNISTMPLSQDIQRRLKFALRGVPELDMVVDKAKKITTAESESSAVNPIMTTKLYPETPKTKEVPVEQLRKKNLNRDEPILRSGEKEKRNEDFTYLYKILALDIASGDIAVATTTSSIKHKASVPRSAAGILVHLDQPAKYFNLMEKLDSQGFKLVSGSRTMLVYRRRTDQEGLDNQTSAAGKKADNNSMRPLREEAVFSGPREPKERLLRSYQLAHRRARSSALVNSTQSIAEPSAENKTDNTEPVKKESIRQKVRRSLMSRTAAVFLAVLICYTAGTVTARRELREFEEGVRKRREEAAARRMELHKNEWKWF